MSMAAVAKQRHWPRPERAPATPPAPIDLTREARLAAWAALLEGRRSLAPIRALDSCERGAARALRKDGSAANVAFADPSLRAAGLRGDSVGDVCDFFELKLDECHRVLCDCGASAILSGSHAAASLRRLARRPRIERARLRLCAGVVVSLGALLGLRLLVG